MKTYIPTHSHNRSLKINSSPVIVGEGLTLKNIVDVARGGASVVVSDDPAVSQRVEQAHNFIQEMIRHGQPIYGVTSGFGGMANVVISPQDAVTLQNNMLWYHKVGAGQHLPFSDVRAAMLIKANSMLQGVSGLRMELVQRIVTFLNAGITPHVPEMGSIGASGDLVPMTYITGCLTGIDPRFIVDFQGETMASTDALKKLDLAPISLLPKEGLALLNSTAVMSGVAANCVMDMMALLGVIMGTHALNLQAMRATNQSFHPFIHGRKPHPGQRAVAAQLLKLLDESQLIRDELDGSHDYRGDELIQDRYSMRTAAQYLGPVLEGIWKIRDQVAVEMNSVTDNPIIDLEQGATYHGGNFLGEYIGVAMDQLRQYIGLIAKHIDAQIALMVSPQFNFGLPPSLVGNPARSANMGLKGLQISMNSIVPLLLFYGNSIADRYLTHAEQFNQNVNSQGYNSANLARRSMDILRDYLAMALIVAVQGVDLRTRVLADHFDARQMLSPATLPLYEAVKDIVGVTPSSQRPYIWDDNDQLLDEHIGRLSSELTPDGRLASAMKSVSDKLAARP